MAQVYGMTPVEVDRLSLPDVAVMMVGAARRLEREEQRVLDAWRRTAEIATMVYNTGGPRGKKFKGKRPDALYPSLYDKREPTFNELASTLNSVARSNGK